jgi:hypothetical protein
MEAHKMALNKNKLQDVSYAGFNVENIEVLERQLREVLNALHKKDWSTALATAQTMGSRCEGLTVQIYRRHVGAGLGFPALVLLVFLALTGAASAQTTCTTLRFGHTTLCTFPDGSGTESAYINGTWTDTEYAPAAWTARYLKLINLDTEFLQDVTAIHAKYRASGAIHAKKPCVAAGFVWDHGICTVKDAK